MNYKIVADGYARLRRGQSAMLAESSRKKSTPEPILARADEPAAIHQPAQAEFWRRKKLAEHQPSAGTLW